MLCVERSLIIPKDIKWKHINLNPTPPTIRGLIEVHKPDSPIRPIINWKNAPAYKVGKIFSEIFKIHIPSPYTFNLKNAIQLMNNILEIPYDHKIKSASFDITNMYSNVPTKNLPQIISLMCDQKILIEN
jgi:hypothetical protein